LFGFWGGVRYFYLGAITAKAFGLLGPAGGFIMCGSSSKGEFGGARQEEGVDDMAMPQALKISLEIIVESSSPCSNSML